MLSCRKSDIEDGLRDYTLSTDEVARIPYDAWNLSTRLLTTLDMDRILDVFATHVARELQYRNFVYRHDPRGIYFSIGTPGPNAVHYRLTLGGQALGTLSLTRDKSFSNEEIRRFEGHVCGLVYALRNALQCRAMADQGA